jgi:hypothetical protein
VLVASDPDEKQTPSFGQFVCLIDLNDEDRKANHDPKVCS